ncbi:MAG: hypothetical protein KDA42_17225 [Planctomycetales bacterium]|nr:hypothetical protein [Planctomycetales bacterium]
MRLVSPSVLLLLFATPIVASETLPHFRDYGEAIHWAEANQDGALLIAFQRDGLPSIPSAFDEEIGTKLAYVELPTDFAWKGQSLLADPAFAALDATPGFARLDMVDSQLRVIATLKEEELNVESFAREILRVQPEHSPLDVELMPRAAIDSLVRRLPAVNDRELMAVFENPRTMWYDDASMPSAYQDSIAPFVGILETRLSGNVAPVEFFENGKFRFPFGDPGGLHRTEGIEGVNFLLLPERDGKRLPIVWWKESESYQWSFPIGTVVGEVLTMRSPDGEPVVFEIRLRRRQKNSWHADAFRPFPTAESLAAAIIQRNTCWDQQPELAELVYRLRDPGTLMPRELKDTYGAFFASGAIDELPPIDPRLVCDLLQETTFESSEGAIWKSNGAMECYAPTAASFSIVPANYDAGLIAVHEISCSRCHQHTGRKIGEFVPSQRLYGQVWGSDGIFSWHPFDPKQLLSSPNGLPANPLRPAFEQAGIVENYDPAKHGEQFYNVLPELRRTSVSVVSF